MSKSGGSLTEYFEYLGGLTRKAKRKGIESVYDRETGQPIDPGGTEQEQMEAIRSGTVPNELSRFTNSTEPLTGRLGTAQSHDSVLLSKILGGANPYPGLDSPRLATEINGQVKEIEDKKEIDQSDRGPTITDTETDGYIEALRGILDPDYVARASEDVMGQYAAMTGGRPSSAAISAGTAARADAEATLLRELLSGGGTQSGESGGLLSGLLGENATTGETDVPEEYAGYADLPGYDTIVPMLESFESEEDMGDYLADMVNKGLISEAVATEYLKRFDDPYEEYDEEGRTDYSSMVKNPGGWTLTDDGGTNFFGGLNRNMRIKSPNGQEFTVAQLYRLLKKNGMDAKEAETYLVKLQNYLKSKK